MAHGDCESNASLNTEDLAFGPLLQKSRRQKQQQQDQKRAILINLAKCMDADPDAGSDDDLQPVRVSHSIGRGGNVQYQVLWSDGSTTMEGKTFLESDWPAIWDEYTHRVRAEAQARLAARRIARLD